MDKIKVKFGLNGMNKKVKLTASLVANPLFLKTGMNYYNL